MVQDEGDAVSDLIALTGASGFLGKRLTALLLAEGFRVRAIHRRERAPSGLSILACDALEIFRANLEKPDESLAALQDADVVIHAAALAKDWGSNRDFMKANVEVTEILLDAARKSGCRQFIFVSSLAVQGFGYHEGSTEEGPYYPIRHPYPDSKKKAESAVLASGSPGFSVAVARLGYVFGPGDTTSTYRIFDAAGKGSFGWIGKGANRTSMIYVDDACQALIKSIGNPAIRGETVNIVGDESISWKDFALLVNKVLDSRKAPVRLPTMLALLAAAALSGIFLVSGSRDGPPLTLYRVRRSTVEYVFSNAKAKHLLGFAPSIGIETGMRMAAAAYRTWKDSVRS